MCNKFIYLILFIISLINLQCASTSSKDFLKDVHSCTDQLNKIEKLKPIDALNGIHNIFFQGCYKEVIESARFVKNLSRDQVYSISKESSEILFYEGTIKDYVLESYERTYLTLLVAQSYKKLNQKENAKIELRKAYEESKAQLRSYGQDSITLFYMAALWEDLQEPKEAEPYYRRILELNKKNTSVSDLNIKAPTEEKIKKINSSEINGQNNLDDFQKLNPVLSRLVAKRLDELQKPNIIPQKWYIYEMGTLPKVNYSAHKMDFIYPPKVGYEKSPLYFTKNKINNCSADHLNTISVSTDEWLQFIRDRELEKKDQTHDLKKMLRLPATILYTSATLGAGLYITQFLSGEAAVDMFVLTVASSYAVFSHGLAPDLRYWNELPQAIAISTHPIDFFNNNCLTEYNTENWFSPVQFL